MLLAMLLTRWEAVPSRGPREPAGPAICIDLRSQQRKTDHIHAKPPGATQTPKIDDFRSVKNV